MTLRELLTLRIATCDALELEALITTLEAALRIARKRSENGTLIDQRMYAGRHDELSMEHEV